MTAIDYTNDKFLVARAAGGLGKVPAGGAISTATLATVLDGLSTSTATAVTASDTVLSGFGKLQSQVTATQTALDAKAPLSHVGAGDTAHAAATTSAAGFMSAADKSKLGGIATGATANSTDATLLARANHTGTQLASTISNFASSVIGSVLTGLSTATSTVVTATDSVLVGIGKLQAQVTANLSTLTSHTGNSSNPHSTTKTQVGLGNVDNTADVDKPISAATQTALDGKLAIPTATTAPTGSTTSLLSGPPNYLSLVVGGVTYYLPAYTIVT